MSPIARINKAVPWPAAAPASTTAPCPYRSPDASRSESRYRSAQVASLAMSCSVSPSDRTENGRDRGARCGVEIVLGDESDYLVTLITPGPRAEAKGSRSIALQRSAVGTKATFNSRSDLQGTGLP